MRSFVLGFLFATLALASNAEAPRETAIALYKAKQFPEARIAFEKIAAENPRDAEAHYYLGTIADRRNDNDEAVKQLEAAVALNPASSEYFASLGEAYGTAANKAGMLAKMSWAKKCQAALEKSIELDPNNLAARNGLVSYYRAAPSFVGGGMPKAYAQAEEIRKRDPLMGASVLAQLYIVEHKYEEAFGLFNEVLEASPDNYLAHYSLGRTAAQSGLHLAEGEKALKRCLELTPGKGDPSHAAVQWRLGNLAEKRGDPAAARTAYESALNLDPGFTQAKAALAKLK
ncbi:MAG: hypothetical protein JWM32_2957 [Verrucomicrobia bacterium]|nr:hypothetical protein [Verrucomicrobiota bacterium]